MYDQILIPTDGSEAVQQAIDESIDVATLTGATLHALSVIGVGDYAGVPKANVALVEDGLREVAERAVADVRDRGRTAGLEVQTAIRHGTPHEEILSYADEQDIDLIVMGTHGRSSLDRVLLGSVTENVVRKADQPVLVKRLREGDNE